MLRYLRRVRKQLIAENKYTKYLQYAIGEIVLVVIGILIALWINNMNDRSFDRDRADNFVEKLKVQLEKNMETVDWHIEINELYYSHSERLLPLIGHKKEVYNDAQIDSLVMFNLYDFNLNLDMNTLIEGRENGDFALIDSEEVSQSIYRLIKSYDMILERERITNVDLNNRFIPYLNKNYNFANLLKRMEGAPAEQFSKVYQDDNYKMLFDQEFENLMMQRQSLGTDLLDSYIDLKAELEAIHNSL